MIELGIQERSAISALQWLPVEGIRAQYAEYLKDCEGCNRIEILRAIVIYRIQEKFYGQRVSRETERLMEKAVEGDKLLHAPADDVRSSWRKLVRNWKGKDYNSLEAQFDACAAYIHSQSGKGWTIVDKHYDDGGYSGISPEPKARG